MQVSGHVTFVVKKMMSCRVCLENMKNSEKVVENQVITFPKKFSNLGKKIAVFYEPIALQQLKTNNLSEYLSVTYNFV